MQESAADAPRVVFGLRDKEVCLWALNGYHVVFFAFVASREACMSIPQFPLSLYRRLRSRSEGVALLANMAQGGTGAAHDMVRDPARGAASQRAELILVRIRASGSAERQSMPP